jgi:hypothetical protein
MKLFLLKRDGSDIGYDQYDSFVIIAKNEEEARNIADNSCGDEGRIWNNKDLVSCDIILPKGSSGIISSSFNAG